MKNTIFIQVGVLTLIVVSVTILLVLTNDFTDPIIIENQDKEFKEKLKLIFPETKKVIEQENDENNHYYEIYDHNDDFLGFAVISEEYGYQSEIRLLIGFENKDSVKSVIILSQEETPGIGTRITEENFISQFKDISNKDASLNSKGGKIDAISGATISSRAVVKAVQEAFEAIK